MTLMLVVLLLGVALSRVVVLAVLLHEDRVGDKAFSHGQEKVVELSTFVLNLFVGFNLLLVGVSYIC